TFMVVHSAQVYIQLKPLFSRHNGIGVQFTDEPTGNLDSRSSEAVIGAFLEAQKELNATTFMVTHDSFSASYCDRVIVMKDGRVYTELTSNGDHRQFMEELLDVLRKMNGGE
ncbi:MAG: hypothetical protein E6124_20850, partial [Blautia producta]|nr:hypothetical protein [Blautia producta]MDU5384618.1 hypothetical protein [Blautia producta]MDU6884980.1 hypothetical protein [Blautia producta]